MEGELHRSMADFFGDKAEAAVFADKFVGFAEHGVERFANRAFFYAGVGEAGDGECGDMEEAVDGILGGCCIVEKSAVFELFGAAL